MPRTKATDKPKEKPKAKAKDARGNKPLKQIESILKVSEIYCLCCGEKKDIDTYYTSDSLQYRAYGRIPYCKDCIDKMYQGYLDEFNRLQYTNCEKRAVQRLCMVLDLYYSDEMYNTAFSDHQKAVVKFDNKDLKFITYYMKNVKMYQYRKRNYNTTINDEYKQMKNDQKTMSMFNGNDEKQQEVVSKAVKFFGRGLSDDEYLFLQNEYEDWTSRHECQTKAQEELIKQICFTQLALFKSVRSGEDSKAKDLNTTLMKQMDAAKLQPKQNKGETVAETQTFGTLIEEWEAHDPIPEVDEELKDVDKIGLFLDVFFRGHLAKMMGLKNGVSKYYDEYMKQFTVNKPSAYKGNDDENIDDSEAIFDALFGNTTSDKEE